MDSKKIAQFMELAGQSKGRLRETHGAKLRALGAQLLLSEVLEYVVHGLGVVPRIDGVPITKPNDLSYEATGESDPKEMVDGLADVAYTMFWNEVAFGIPLERAFEMVCDNNLEKFVKLDGWSNGVGPVQEDKWGLGKEVSWPKEVVSVSILKIAGEFFAVGKDSSGKVRKPSTYKSVDLSPLLEG